MEFDETERLIELYGACQRVTAHLGPRDDALARAIRETCIDIERRLKELGLQVDDPANMQGGTTI